MTDIEMNKKLTEPMLTILKEMNKGLDGMTEDGSDFYEQNFYFGFGNPKTGIHTAEIYVCPESYEAMEQTLSDLIDFINEEYPVERLVRENGEFYYIDKDGTRYDIGELKSPGNGGRTFDILTLNNPDFPDADGSKDSFCINWIYGATVMTDDEILDFCRKSVAAEKNKTEK